MAILILDGKILHDRFLEDVQAVEKSDGTFDVVAKSFGEESDIVLKNFGTHAEAESYINDLGTKMLEGANSESRYIDARTEPDTTE